MTLIEGDQKAPFSIATTPGCRGGRYSFPRIKPLYPLSEPYNTECPAREYQVPYFESLVWLDLGLNPDSRANPWSCHTKDLTPCLTVSNIRYVSRVKWSNPGKREAPSPTPRCSCYWNASLLIALDYGRQTEYSALIPSNENENSKTCKNIIIKLSLNFKEH